MTGNEVRALVLDLLASPDAGAASARWDLASPSEEDNGAAAGYLLGLLFEVRDVAKVRALLLSERARLRAASGGSGAAK